MSDDRRSVMASTFRAWWQSLVELEPNTRAPGNVLNTGALLAFLAETGARHGAIVTAAAPGHHTPDSAPELNPNFDWNGEIALGPDAPIADLERASGISEQAPLA